MPYAPFHEKFPDIAKAETRTLTTIQNSELPVDSYGLIEMFCDEPDCNCRRVMWNVSSWSTGKTLAVIAYGWGSKEFYADWFGGYDEEVINEMQGPILNTASRQSKFAPTLLKLVTRYALQDQKYIRRVKRHYRMFRKAIEQKQETRNKEEKYDTY